MIRTEDINSDETETAIRMAVSVFKGDFNALAVLHPHGKPWAARLLLLAAASQAKD